MLGDYRRYVYICNVTNQELIGKPDRLRRTVVVHKERRCDATFAYQQIMNDVRREVLDYTSRYVFVYVSNLSYSNVSIVLIVKYVCTTFTGKRCAALQLYVGYLEW